MLQKDIERFEIFGIDGKWLIKDNKQLPNLLDCYQSCARLNQQDQRIAELEEQLKNAIVLPKNLQVGNKVFWANEDGLFIGEIKTISQDTAVWFYVVYDNRLTYWHLLEHFNSEVFATKEDAIAKLEELQKLK